MFSQKAWDEILTKGAQKSYFERSIPGGYVVFGSYGMTISKRIRQSWMEKTINDWRNKTCEMVNQELKAMPWESEV